MCAPSRYDKGEVFRLLSWEKHFTTKNMKIFAVPRNSPSARLLCGAWFLFAFFVPFVVQLRF